MSESRPDGQASTGSGHKRQACSRGCSGGVPPGLPTLGLRRVFGENTIARVGRASQRSKAKYQKSKRPEAESYTNETEAAERNNVAKMTTLHACSAEPLRPSLRNPRARLIMETSQPPPAATPAPSPETRDRCPDNCGRETSRAQLAIASSVSRSSRRRRGCLLPSRAQPGRPLLSEEPRMIITIVMR